jgi:hypothetical protein
MQQIPSVNGTVWLKIEPPTNREQILSTRNPLSIFSWEAPIFLFLFNDAFPAKKDSLKAMNDYPNITNRYRRNT